MPQKNHGWCRSVNRGRRIAHRGATTETALVDIHQKWFAEAGWSLATVYYLEEQPVWA